MKSKKVYVSDIPELLAEWDYEKNLINPNEITVGSNKKAWWLCKKCHHSWQATIGSRHAGNGCPKCAKIKISEKRRKFFLNGGENTLRSINPDLCCEWDYEKNAPFTPDEFAPYSNTKVWWRCKQCGYSWLAAISYRNNGTGCPACLNRVLWKGHNDLETVCPDLANEWYYEKNAKSPNEYVAGGHTKVWWKCSNCGNIWKASIHARVKGTGCPKCSFSTHTSLAEQCIFYYISKDFPDAINSYRPTWLNGKELDIFLPEYRIGIEYDGGGWHKTTSKDENKTKIIIEHGIQLIRIREPDCPNIKDGSIVIKTEPPKSNLNYLQKALSDLYSCLSSLMNQDLKFNGSVTDEYLKVLDDFKKKRLDNSLASTSPELLQEWDTEKNQGLSPYKISANSNIRVYWKCHKCGYSWLSSIDHRQKGYGCARCAGQVVWKGHNDLATLHPELLDLWNYEKNSILPNEITSNAHKKIWWKCNVCGGEWQSYVYNVSSGHGCPFCSGNALKVGYNDLASRFPNLAEEWDVVKNNGLSPKDVSPGNKKKVWWICSVCHFEWLASINSRVNGRGCPVCAKQKISAARSKPVLQYSLNHEFIGKYDSATQARRVTGATSIIACCQHKRKTSGGFIWRYADEKEEN